MTTAAPSYKRHRYASEIIDHCVWLYFRFTLSFRDVEELMLERGVVVSYETIRRWCDKFGQAYANRLRRRRARPGDKWFLDEVFVRINGVQHLRVACRRPGRHTGRAGSVPSKYQGGQTVLPKLLKGLEYVPRVIVTDKLGSY